MIELLGPRGIEEWGTAEEIAQALTSTERPITANRVRDWARRARNPRDRLYGMLPAYNRPGERRGTTWYPLASAARVELATRSRVGAASA